MTHLILPGEVSSSTSLSLSNPARKILCQCTGVYVEVRHFVQLLLVQDHHILVTIVLVTIVCKTFLNIW